jgi:hypothetical protein
MMRHLRPPTDGPAAGESGEGGDAMIVEIDTRAIPGIGEVCWQLDDDGGHVVTVIDLHGAVQARLPVADGTTARELFEHPFSRPGVPNLFAVRRAPA